MKNVLPLLLATVVAVSCNNTPAPNPAPTANQAGIDTTAISETIHNFYAWYEKFSVDQTRCIDYFDESGAHLKLDTAKLEQYYRNLRASGAIGESFIDADRQFWIDCSKLWQNEPKGDVPSCVDYDRFFCAQDWDINFWTKAGVQVTQLQPDRVKAILSGTEGGAPRQQTLELQKENGKWMIAKIVCE